MIEGGIPLLTLSVRNPPPRKGWLMAVLKVYFDDSGEEEDPQHKVCAVAGYVGSPETWSRVETEWSAVLDRHRVPYLHMKELAHFAAPHFDRFENDEPGRIALLTDLIDVIGRSDLVGLGSATRLADLRRFNAERGTSIQAYPFNLYTNMTQLSDRWPDDIIEIVIDRTTNHGPKAAKARQYADSDAYYPKCGKNIQLMPLDSSLSAKTVPALQLADFLAWESRKDIDTKDEWFSNYKTGDDLSGWLRSLKAWSDNTGRKFPYNRKSVSALIRAREIDGVVWDYRGICTVDKARKGVWP